MLIKFKLFIELVFRAANDLDTFGHLTYKTVQLIEQAQSFDGNPIFSILHEAIYCQGYYDDSCEFIQILDILLQTCIQMVCGPNITGLSSVLLDFRQEFGRIGANIFHR